MILLLCALLPSFQARAMEYSLETQYASSAVDQPATQSDAPLSSETPRTKAKAAVEFKFMTFNIRFDNPDDGVNQWVFRKEQVVKVIDSRSPDIFGLQEVLWGQVQYVAYQLPQYTYFGRGRRKEFWDDEGCPIFYQINGWEPLAQEVFWLSDTPYEPGSTSYGNTLPRICTYMKLASRQTTGKIVHAYNCHLDHISEESRQKSASQIKRHMKEKVPPEENIVLLGDFNVPPDTPALKIFETELFPLQQTMNQQQRAYATFHNWKGIEINEEEHIDFVLYKSGQTQNYTIIHDNNQGFYPSDHYPVLTTISM